jgi:hypothetical protein
VAPVGLLVLTAFPFLCYFGGLNLLGLGGVLLLTLLWLLVLGSVSILAAVCSQTTGSAVLTVYTLGMAAVLLVWRVGGPFRLCDPRYYLEPLPAGVGQELLVERLLLAIGIWGGFALLCAGLAAWQLRPAWARQQPASLSREQYGRTSRPAVSDQPVRWKERHIEGIAPLPSLRRIPRWFGISAIVLATAVVAYVLRRTEWGFAGLGTTALLVFGLTVACRCVDAVSGERERQTWEALLLTGMNARELVRDKLLGILDASYPYLAAYALPALVVSGQAGLSALFWVLFLLALCWPVAYFMGGIAIRRSLEAANTWKSLAGTLATVGGITVGLLQVGYWPLLIAPLAASLLVQQLGPGPGTQLLATMVLVLPGGVLLAALYGYIGHYELHRSIEWLDRLALEPWARHLPHGRRSTRSPEVPVAESQTNGIASRGK